MLHMFQQFNEIMFDILNKMCNKVIVHVFMHMLIDMLHINIEGCNILEI